MSGLYARLTRRYRPQSSAMERREFLRIALAASAGLLLSEQTFARAERGRRVIVIGGGFAGLACAHELLGAGCDVVVLEARARVGGRVLSFGDLLPGKVVEGGGELIGRNHPTWMAFARKFGLEFNDVTEEENLDWPVVLDGKRLTPNESKALLAEMEAAYKVMNAAAASIDADQPWNSPDARRLDARRTAQWIRGLAVSDLCKRALTVEFAANNGVATAHQSLLGNLTQVKGGGLARYWTETEVYRCRGGNAQLARKLAAAIGEDRLHIGTPVREINVSENKVSVRDASGRLYEGDDVVLAVPPSTWHNIRFSPSLPRALRPQMGINVKYLARVKRRFWREARLLPESLSDGIASLTWEGTNNQGSDAHGAVLTAFSGGPAAERARQAFARDKDRAYVAPLSEIYPAFPEIFSGGRFMNWPNELWTGAGYSFPAPGQITAIGSTLRNGIGRLHFAGEHTCYAFVGYMEGALNSGVAVAKRLVRQSAPAYN
ncbi:MAG: flavin monoamine oxidase family protein [Chthoniobacterales bacterium]